MASISHFGISIPLGNPDAISPFVPVDRLRRDLAPRVVPARGLELHGHAGRVLRHHVLHHGHDVREREGIGQTYYYTGRSAEAYTYERPLTK